SKDLNNILTKINQISNVDDNKLLLLIRCKINIESKKYYKAKLDLDRLYSLITNYYEDILHIYLLQEYSNFWLYLVEIKKINVNNYCKFSEIGIIHEFDKYMYKGKNLNLLIS